MPNQKSERDTKLSQKNKAQHMQVMWEQAFDSLDHPFYIIDAQDYSILTANTVALRNGAPGATTCHALTHRSDVPCSSAEHPCPLKQVLETKKAFTVEHIHPNEAGEPRLMEVHGYPISDDEGNVIQMVEYSVDITDRKLAEQRLNESEERYHRLSEASVEGIVIHDKGILIDANALFADMFGYEHSEVIGMPATEFLTPETREITAQNIRSGYEKPYEVMGLRKDGSTFPVEITGKAIPYEGRTVRVTALRDITEQKQAMDKVRETQQMLEGFLENFPDGAWAKDLDGRFVLANRYTYEKIFGSSTVDALLGKTVHDIFPQEVADSLWESEKRLIETSETLSVEEAVPQADGKTYNKITTKFPLYDTNGNISGLGGVLIDITERKHLEAQAQEAFERRGYQVQVSTEISQQISQATELGELFERVVTLTKERLGYYHTQLLRYDPNQDAVVLAAGYGETGQKMFAEGHHMPMGSGLIGTAAATGETVMRPELARDPDWKPNPLLPDTQGEIAVPIKLGDEVLGVLDVQSDQAGALSDDDRLLLEGLCGQIAIAMEQTRLRQEMEERLREINNLYRTMSHEGWQSYRETESLPSGFIYDQVAIRPVEETSLATDLFANAPMVLPGGETLGELGLVDDPDKPLSEEDKAFLEQVSEQVALALESARLTEQTQLALARTDELYGISQAMNEATSESDVLEVLTRPAIEAGAIAANLLYLDLDEKGNPAWAEIVATWRLDGEDLVPVGTRFYLPEMPFAKLWMANVDEPLLISDIRTDERVDDTSRAAIEEGGNRTIAIVPLTRAGERVGLITYDWKEPHTFSQDEIETYRAIIGLASPAIQSRRLFEQARHQADREAMLNTINQKIQSATSVEAVLQIAARELGHALGAPMTVAQLRMKDQN